MTMIEITRMEDVRVGDDITLTRDGLKVSGRVRPEGTAVDLADWSVYFPGIGTLYGRDGWVLVSATREVPEWEPGTAGTASVHGVEGVRVMRTSGTGGADVMWLSASMVSGVRSHEGCHVTDFVPDDAEALRARAERLEIELEAEVERLSAEARRVLSAALDDVDWPDTISGHMTITLTDMHRCACHAPLAPSVDRYMAEMAHLTHLSAIIRAALLGGAA